MGQIRKRLSPEARREQLIDAAIACYGEMGIERAGHGDVAKRAGVSTATVFNYFGTREILTNTVISAVYEAFRNMFTTATASNATPQEHIQNMADNYDFLVEQHPDIIKVLLNWSSSYGGSVRPQYLEFQAWLLSGIQVRLHDSNSDPSDARIILATAYSYALMKLDNTSDDVLESFVTRIVKAIG
ncbi:MAG: TetR/AcrR family transcriptional regulator [Hellea sp.]